MTCPKCGEKSKVVDVAKDVSEIVRLRRCKVCNSLFYTAEQKMDPIEGYDVIRRIRYGAKCETKKERAFQMKIKIKYFSSDLEQLEKIAVGDWIDLRASMTVMLNKGEYGLIPLGVGMILPDDYEAHILPRSSTPSKFGIMCANSMSVIDNSYSGDADEWHFPAVAIRDTIIHKGDRIAQFRIVKNQPSIEFEVVEHLNEKSRGGIGSTGAR